MRKTLFPLLALFLSTIASAKTFIVKGGQPNATIVIADDAMRTTRLVAAELQETLQKISGEVAGQDLPGQGVSIYVGESIHTQKLGVSAEGLEHGAYRIKSGESWLILLGADSEFEPIEPWGKNNRDVVENLQRRWEDASGLPYGVTNQGFTRTGGACPRSWPRRRRSCIGFMTNAAVTMQFAVSPSLGVRWYAPGLRGKCFQDGYGSRFRKSTRWPNRISSSASFMSALAGRTKR